MSTPAEVREAESRWARPVAVLTILAVVLFFVANFASPISGTENYEVLESVHEHSSGVTVSGLMQSIAIVLLIFPLVYLFRADRARSERVRGQLIGLVVVAPLFLAASFGLAVGVRHEAADQFVNGEAKATLSPKEANEECASERKDEGKKEFAEEVEPKTGETALAACEGQKIEEDEASNALSEASLAPLAGGLGLAGSLGFVVTLFYISLWAMRTGLLTRFWGSLGMASGIAFLLGPLLIVTLAWFLFFGMMLLGLARPPAWDAGEAIPWPSPGEKAAAELEPPSEEAEERRKRKQRNGSEGQSE